MFLEPYPELGVNSGDHLISLGKMNVANKPLEAIEKIIGGSKEGAFLKILIAKGEPQNIQMLLV